jgi:hypothetical protein
VDLEIGFLRRRKGEGEEKVPAEKEAERICN